jgi:hypothetical protein
MIPKVRECDQHLLARHTGNTLYGLQDMDGRLEQARALFGALERQIELFDGIIDAAQAMQGLLDRELPPASHIRELVGAKVIVQRESDPEETILHLASVVFIDGMAVPVSVPAACDAALPKECARAEGRRRSCTLRSASRPTHGLEMEMCTCRRRAFTCID